MFMIIVGVVKVQPSLVARELPLRGCRHPLQLGSGYEQLRKVASGKGAGEESQTMHIKNPSSAPLRLNEDTHQKKRNRMNPIRCQR